MERLTNDDDMLRAWLYSGLYDVIDLLELSEAALKGGAE